jgi:hypothetical protein
LLECLMLYIAMLSFRPWKLLCALMSAKASSSEALDVSPGKASSTAEGFADRILEMEDWIESGRRARSATARFPCEGEERMRAIPEPWRLAFSLLVCGSGGRVCTHGVWPGADKNRET